jgi:hypothetical protein
MSGCRPCVFTVAAAVCVDAEHCNWSLKHELCLLVGSFGIVCIQRRVHNVPVSRKGWLGMLLWCLMACSGPATWSILLDTTLFSVPSLPTRIPHLSSCSTVLLSRKLRTIREKKDVQGIESNTSKQRNCEPRSSQTAVVRAPACNIQSKCLRCLPPSTPLTRQLSVRSQTCILV